MTKKSNQFPKIIIFLFVVVSINCNKKQLASLVLDTLASNFGQARNRVANQAMQNFAKQASQNVRSHFNQPSKNFDLAKSKMDEFKMAKGFNDIKSSFKPIDKKIFSGQAENTANQIKPIQQALSRGDNKYKMVDTGKNPLNSNEIPFYYPLTQNKPTILPIQNRVTFKQREGWDDGSTSDYYAEMRRHLNLPENYQPQLQTNVRAANEDSTNFMEKFFGINNDNKKEISKRIMQDHKPVQSMVHLTKPQLQKNSFKDSSNEFSINHLTEAGWMDMAETKNFVFDNHEVNKSIGVIENQPKDLIIYNEQPSNLMTISSKQFDALQPYHNKQKDLLVIKEEPRQMIKYNDQPSNVMEFSSKQFDSMQPYENKPNNLMISKQEPKDLLIYNEPPSSLMEIPSKQVDALQPYENVVKDLLVPKEEPKDLFIYNEPPSSLMEIPSKQVDALQPYENVAKDLLIPKEGPKDLLIYNEQPSSLMEIPSKQVDALQPYQNAPKDLLIPKQEPKDLLIYNEQPSSLMEIPSKKFDALQPYENKPKDLLIPKEEPKNLIIYNEQPSSLVEIPSKKLDALQPYENRPKDLIRYKEEPSSLVKIPSNRFNAIQPYKNEPKDLMVVKQQPKEIIKYEEKPKALMNISQTKFNVIQPFVNHSKDLIVIKDEPNKLITIDHSNIPSSIKTTDPINTTIPEMDQFSIDGVKNKESQNEQGSSQTMEDQNHNKIATHESQLYTTTQIEADNADKTLPSEPEVDKEEKDHFVHYVAKFFENHIRASQLDNHKDGYVYARRPNWNFPTHSSFGPSFTKFQEHVSTIFKPIGIEEKGNLFYDKSNDQSTIEKITNEYDQVNVPVSFAEKVYVEVGKEENNEGDLIVDNDKSIVNKFVVEYMKSLPNKLGIYLTSNTSTKETVSKLKTLDEEKFNLLLINYKLEPAKKEMNRETLMDLPYYNLVLNIEELCIEEFLLKSCNEISFRLLQIYKRLSQLDKRNYTVIKSIVNNLLQEEFPELLTTIERTYQENYVKHLDRSQHMYDRLEFLLYAYVQA